jgi:hypothetical protein
MLVGIETEQADQQHKSDDRPPIDTTGHQPSGAPGLFAHEAIGRMAVQSRKTGESGMPSQE